MWSASFLSATLFRPAWDTRWLAPGRRSELNAAKGLRENWNGRVCARNIQLWSAISVFLSPRIWDLLDSLADGQWQHFPYWCPCVYPFFFARVFCCGIFSLRLCTFVWLCSHCFFFLFLIHVSGFKKKWFVLFWLHVATQILLATAFCEKRKLLILGFQHLYFIWKLIFPSLTVKDDAAFWDHVLWVQVGILIALCYLCYCLKWNWTMFVFLFSNPCWPPVFYSPVWFATLWKD